MTANEDDIPLIKEAAQDAHVWINDIAAELGDMPKKSAYHALRGVLFALRDRIMPEEAAHLGDQLPTFIRGVYYESYQHGGKPEIIRHLEEFLEKIRHETEQGDPAPEPEAALIAVTAVLAKHIDEGQYRQVKDALPLEIQEKLGA
ncbi:MAG TPA: DUF2267 domain-containing protein [Opitutales bacterium]|nr:DUF2267 domain-containing protein [Opitutales bacterium]